jgi:transcriptional regulator with XRE-family HTH domain
MTDSIQQKIARRLKTHRENANMSQLEIANATGIAVNTYARLERGESLPSTLTLIKIAKALNIKTSDILGS